MIIKKIEFDDFVRAFHALERGNQFPSTLRALFDHLESFSEETGADYDLDVIGLCCGYVEYSHAEMVEYYGSVAAAKKSDDYIADGDGGACLFENR